MSGSISTAHSSGSSRSARRPRSAKPPNGARPARGDRVAPSCRVRGRLRVGQRQRAVDRPATGAAGATGGSAGIGRHEGCSRHRGGGAEVPRIGRAPGAVGRADRDGGADPATGRVAPAREGQARRRAGTRSCAATHAHADGDHARPGTDATAAAPGQEEGEEERARQRPQEGRGGLSSLGEGSTLFDGRYRLEQIIGRGGMAIVWRATDLQLEREVAIKVISDVLASDPSFVARFEREARLAAGLSHPNLVKVFDFSIEAERPFLVMEYIAGVTLAEARSGPVDVEALGRELLDAVAHIHAAGILHRDIKPANVLLGPEGSPRLTDFGIARGEETGGLTLTGQVLGTLRYIAPEVAAGQPATPESDLYSLGVLLDELPGPRSEALGRLVQRMAAQSPAERPGSAGEALAELEPTRILPGAPPPPGPAPEPLPDKTPSARSPSRLQALAAALVLVAVLVLVVIAASGGGDSEPNRQPALAPSGAPADQQVQSLEQIVRSLP